MTIGIVGGGIGGLSLALGLANGGHSVRVFEQAAAFGQVGADVNLTPNATRALDGLDAEVGRRVRETAARPTRRISRAWDTGEVTSDLQMNLPDDDHGAQQLTVHRAALMDALRDSLPSGVLRLGHRLERFEAEDDQVRLSFAGDADPVTVSALVGADGIHSVVRHQLFGEQEAEYTGLVAYRAVVPRERLEGLTNLDSFTKWWGPDPAIQLVTFPLNRGRDIFVFATTAQTQWTEESWTTQATADEFRADYQDFHSDARRLLDACEEVMKSALRIREPMPQWTIGRVTLLGDACHPMTPFMAQGAGQAIEDAVVLARALTDGFDSASMGQRLRSYEHTRRERTARIQRGSRANDWLKIDGETDWLYGYDAWRVPLVSP